MWFETTRFVYFVKLKHASRTFFDLKLQRTAFHSKNAPKKCSQSSPRGPKTSPKCLRELPGDVLRGHTHLPSGPGASPIRQSGQSVVNSSKVEHPRDALGDSLDPQPLPAPRPPNYSYYYNLHLFSSYFTFCYLRLPYVYRHAETGVGGFKRPAATCADPERALAPQLPRRDQARRSPNRERVHRARTSLRRPCVIGLFQFCALVRIS